MTYADVCYSFSLSIDVTEMQQLKHFSINKDCVSTFSCISITLYKYNLIKPSSKVNTKKFFMVQRTLTS